MRVIKTCFVVLLLKLCFFLLDFVLSIFLFVMFVLGYEALILQFRSPIRVRHVFVSDTLKYFTNTY